MPYCEDRAVFIESIANSMPPDDQSNKSEIVTNCMARFADITGNNELRAVLQQTYNEAKLYFAYLMCQLANTAEQKPLLLRFDPTSQTLAIMCEHVRDNICDITGKTCNQLSLDNKIFRKISVVSPEEHLDSLPESK